MTAEQSSDAADGPDGTLSHPARWSRAVRATETRTGLCPWCGYIGPGCGYHGCPSCHELAYGKERGPGGGCEACYGLGLASYFLEFPGAECELADCTHCTEPGCNACMKTGRVCRHCARCVDHADPGQADACTGTRWSQLHRAEVEFHVPSTYNRHTGLWSETSVPVRSPKW